MIYYMSDGRSPFFLRKNIYAKEAGTQIKTKNFSGGGSCAR
jgi:hypothetical protein